MSKSSPSLLLRGCLAIVLLVGFYVLAIAIAAGLLYLVYVTVAYGRRVDLRLIVGAIAAAGTILWAIIPRRDKFVAPGPELTPEAQPRLFAELRGIAEAVQQDMPREVYLAPDVNAWVAQRGGVMSIGSRRVMGLGLPLLQILSVSELRAVLAHEFGHYDRGDTQLGPWIYRTRATIVRTLQSLGDSVVRLPFQWYGNLFLRITHAISRRQEYAADALAARVVGPEPLIGGLRAIQGAAAAFFAFWRDEMTPVLNAGFRAPMAEGFALFIEASRVADAVSKAVEQNIANPTTSPYDTHPPLRDRIAALRALPSGPATGNSARIPAISLLENVPELEMHLLAAMANNPTAVTSLRPLSWNDVGRYVYVPQWEKAVDEQASALNGMTFGSLPEIARNVDQFSLKLKLSGLVTLQQRKYLAFQIVGAALAVALQRHGWTLHLAPGGEVLLRRGEVTVNPFSILPRLATGDLTPARWREWCVAVGVTDLELLPPVLAASATG